MLPPQRFFPNNNLHISPQTVESTEALSIHKKSSWRDFQELFCILRKCLLYQNGNPIRMLPIFVVGDLSDSICSFFSPSMLRV